LSAPPSDTPIAAALSSGGWLLVLVVGALAIVGFLAFLVYELRLDAPPEEARELPPPRELPGINDRQERRS
jgi:hypothetical protein